MEHEQESLFAAILAIALPITSVARKQETPCHYKKGRLATASFTASDSNTACLKVV